MFIPLIKHRDRKLGHVIYIKNSSTVKGIMIFIVWEIGNVFEILTSDFFSFYYCKTVR